MSDLDATLADRLRRAVREQEMTLRNWSGSDAWVFAIYNDYDTYLGTVRLHAESATLAVRDDRWTSKRERTLLDGLCRAFNCGT